MTNHGHSPPPLQQDHTDADQAEAEVSIVVKSPSKGRSSRSARVLFQTDKDDRYVADQDSTPIVKNDLRDRNNPELSDPSSNVDHGPSTIHSPMRDEVGTAPNHVTADQSQLNDAEKPVPSTEVIENDAANENGEEDRGLPSSGSDSKRITEPQYNLRHRGRNSSKRSRPAARVLDGGSRTAFSRDKPRRRNKKPAPTKPEKENFHMLPASQYETVLVRRAILKREGISAINNDNEQNAASEGSIQDMLDTYGDVSLGMQLTPIGGKIIVQGIIPLKDGRASPAQLAGCIERGDVLLQINHQSLVNQPFEQLMLSLLALSKPLPDGTHPRKTMLRFAAGQGLDLLRTEREDQISNEKQKQDFGTGGVRPEANAEGPDNVDGAADILGLFSMVDQLSGMPLQPQENLQPPATPVRPTTPPPPAVHQIQSETKPMQSGAATTVGQGQTQKRLVSLEDAISRLVATERYAEREECNSEFFSWNTNFSVLLRRPSDVQDLAVAPSNNVSSDSTKLETMELGYRALKGARRLSAILEKIDRGWSDRRSFHSLSATLSLYSKASTRRRYVLDGKAMPVNFEELDEEGDENEKGSTADDESSGVGSNDEDDALDGDALLLQLASQDEIWRKQVIEFLEDVVEKLNNPGDNAEEDSPEKAAAKEASALSSELGSFLFGDRMTKALMLHKKVQALPPDEITALLFDLTTNISATVPDQIMALGTNATVRSTLVPFIAMKKPSATSNVMLAARFMLDDVLPVWLKTFRPLPWEQRRVLWPLEKAPVGESTGGGSVRSDDSMTVDSFGTRQQSPTVSRRKSKNLREQIEEQELNAETRSETCFLATFYFTQQLLPRLRNESAAGQKVSPSAQSRVKINEEAFQAAKAFVKDYGAYLRLHTCIAYSGVMRAHDIIKVLLDVAKHDPLHKETIRRFSRAGALIFYEPGTLSAIVERLQNLKNEDREQQSVTIQLCASAYPDVRPWQVNRECRGLWRRDHKSTNKQASEWDELYYMYLTYLLHPSNDNEMARSDSSLISEWSELSARGYLQLQKSSPNSPEASEKKRNFYCVASKASSDHLAYSRARDLTTLLGLSMEMKEYVLALDLATEILDDSGRSKRKALFASMMRTLRSIGRVAIESFTATDATSRRSLKRIFRLFQRAHGLGSETDPWVVNTSTELVNLLTHAEQCYRGQNQQNLTALLEFFSKEVNPKDLLKALSKWLSNDVDDIQMHLIEVLRTTLYRGAIDSSSVVEMSSALLRVKQTRTGLLARKHHSAEVDPKQGTRLWQSMSQGTLSLAK
mmetsp:Transcript_16747/g.46019  ORF Transcript_16747/g.46019 Transcript_16747/m.46019 type:complete len:1288 (+) Transcript_16747:157-4020(+)